MHTSIRALVALAAGGLLSLGPATPAQAHQLRYGDDPSNWQSTVTRVDPVRSVRASIGDGVQRLTVSIGRASEVIVTGYNGEPFVRLRANGAWVNTRSSTTYAVRGPQAAVPSYVDNSAAPVWRRVSSKGTWSWHDSRTHWPGYALPPPVEQAPNSRMHVLDWRVPLVADGAAGAISGSLDWVPGPSGGLGAGIATAAFAAGAAVLALRRRTLALGIALACLVGVDVAHSVGMVAGRIGDAGSRLAALPGHGGLPLSLWLASAVTGVLLWRRREVGFYAAALVAALFCFTEALPSLAVLWRSQAVNALPIAANRALVAVLMGGSVAVFAVAVAIIIRSAPPHAAIVGNSSATAGDS